MKVRTILATKGMAVITIGSEQPLKEAVARLTQHGIGALVVVDQANKPVGIISERDIIHELNKSEPVVILSRLWPQRTPGCHMPGYTSA